jgi:glycosyltransferase involved in cell wall biosynthesis
MNIAVDTNCILPGRVGGIENYTNALIEALAGPGSPADRVIVLTRPENHQSFARFASRRTVIHAVDRPTYQGRPVANWASLTRNDPAAACGSLAKFQVKKAALLRKLRVDVLHCPGNTINPIDLELPIVLNLHDLQHRHFPQHFSTSEIDNRETWWTASARRADALIAASDYVRDDLVEQLDVDGDKIFVTPDPIESAFTDEVDATAVDRVRANFRVPAVSFLYPAAAWPHKNHHRLVDAFKLANIPEARLLLTGGGQADGQLAAMVADAGMTGRIELLGRVTTAELVGLYRSVTATLVPSRHESWSIPVAEAMACGCPVACSDVTSLPQQVDDAAILFGPDDVPAMADAMRRLATDAELRSTLVERGYRRAAYSDGRHFVQTLTRAYSYAAECRSMSKRRAA